MGLPPRTYAYLLIWAVFACSAQAAPTTLNIIPTADVIPDRNAAIMVQLAGGDTSSGFTFVNQFQTELGLWNDVELGWDGSLGPGGQSPWNAKYRICGETKRRPAIAVGFYTNTSTVGGNDYLTMYKSLGTSRLHVGAITVGGSLRAMAGWDIWSGGHVVPQIDWISGPKTYTSVGVLLNFDHGWSLCVSQLLGNSASSPNGYLAFAGWTGPVL